MNNRTVYIPDCGEDITTAIKNSLDLSKKLGLTTSFTFNGIEMKTTYPIDTEEDLLIGWEGMCSKRQSDYEQTEVYKSAKVNEELERVSVQEDMDSLVPELNQSIENEDLLKWLIDFTNKAGHIGITYDKDYVLDELRKLGFEDNMWVGHKGEWTEAHNIEYVVGQVINCINTFGQPHPVTVTFCEKILNGEGF